MKKTFFGLLILLASLILIAGCDSNNNDDELIKVKLLTTGYVNLGTDNNDPYRQWIKDNYNLDISLEATSDLTGRAVTAFASNDKPDIVVFEKIDDFNMIYGQNVLLADWTPYLDKMPNVKSNIERKDDKTGEESIAKKMMTGETGNLKAIWTVADAPTWSLKIREDWADEYRQTTTAGANYPAGNVATNGEPWNPNTPEDLLNFARWIKANKPNSYAFTSAGGGNSLGTLGNWLPLMWGAVAEVPYGVYIDSDNKISFPVVDGTHELMLNYLKTIVSEDLIDPQWYVQSWAQKTKTQQGLIGIEWYPGAITTETESYNEAQDGRTVDWWKTYSLPVAPGYESTGGFLPAGNFIGKIITISKKASLDSAKMEAILKLLNDVSVYYDDEENRYIRPVAYDALRWGVGVEDHLKFIDVEGTNYQYINVKGGYKDTSAGTGAWDWGAWISTTRDGVIQGNEESVSKITQKVIEHNERTALMKTYVEVGNSFVGYAELVQKLRNNQINYEYNYVTGEKVQTYEAFLVSWKTSWGGNTLLEEIEKQFRDYGLLE